MSQTTIKLKYGFSIELEGYTLEYRGEYDGLPLYETVEGNVTAIALVDEPAFESYGVATERLRMIYGAVMIPDMKLFRKEGPNGPEECYWYFSSETIKKLQSTFRGAAIKFGH